MKRILVIDDSLAVRETLALILGREYEIVHRSPSASDAHPLIQESDLAIFGVPPGSLAEPSALSRLAAGIPIPALFLLDSVFGDSPSSHFESSARVDWLAKPFSPYELRQKVGRLLADAPGAPELLVPPPTRDIEAVRDLEFPYLPKAVSALARGFAESPLPILILGERGCGQERIASAIHALRNAAGMWISLSAAEINRGMLRDLVSQRLRAGRWGKRPTLFLNGLESLDPLGQSELWRFLEDKEREGKEFALLSTSQVDLLEKVYRQEFVDGLYYRLATLVLRIPPLRERTQDLPVLAARIVQNYAARLGLGEVRLSEDALQRINNYLWFGNLDEMRTVLARALATHRRAVVEGADLAFMVGNEGEVTGTVAMREAESSTTGPFGESPQPITAGDGVVGERQRAAPAVPRMSPNGDLPDLTILLNELAHEFKNPMVTIKTFSQLLEERFDDASFRARFQETVGNDIQRMNELLEVLLEFSRLSQPDLKRVLIDRCVNHAIEAVAPGCVPKGATIQWARRDERREAYTDETQLCYALKNVLEAALAESTPGRNIDVGVEGGATISVSYCTDEEQMSPLTPYLGFPPASVAYEGLPLRLLLARAVLQRLGGKLAVERRTEGKISIQLQLPEV